MSTYEEYRQLRRDIGFPEENAINEFAWNGCDPGARESALKQLRPAAKAARERLSHYGGDHW